MNFINIYNTNILSMSVSSSESSYSNPFTHSASYSSSDHVVIKHSKGCGCDVCCNKPNKHGYGCKCDTCCGSKHKHGCRCDTCCEPKHGRGCKCDTCCGLKHKHGCRCDMCCEPKHGHGCRCDTCCGIKHKSGNKHLEHHYYIKTAKLLKEVALLTKANLNDLTLMKCKLRSDIFNGAMTIRVFENTINKYINRLEVAIPCIFKSSIFTMLTPTKIELKIGSELFTIGGNLSLSDTNTDLLKKLDDVYANHILFLRYLKLKYRCFYDKAKYGH